MRILGIDPGYATIGFSWPIRSSISVPIWYSRRESGNPAGVVMAP